MPEDTGWLGGLFVPVTTPFDPVTGDIAPVSFRDNLRRWLETPIDGFVVFGSTGEGALLDEDEMVRLMEYARDVIPPQRPLVAGAGGESTRTVVRLSKRFAEAGADAVLVHPPSYFGVSLSPGDLRDHYREVADGSPVPVLVYHMPKFTHVTLDAGLIGELSRHENIVGIKDSSGDLKQFAEYTDSCEESCRLFVGNGALLYAALELGAVGGILALGLLAPHEYGELIRQYRGGKAGLDLKGWSGGPPRPPLRPLAGRDRESVARVMQEARLL